MYSNWQSKTPARRKDLFYVVIDGDKAAGIKELLSRDGKTVTIRDMSQKWIVEHHKDNPEKAHFGFYSPIRFPKSYQMV